MKNQLKKINRTLLELETGILFYGILGQLVCLFFKNYFFSFSIGWWFGVVVACFLAWHMWFTLDQALNVPENAANKVRLAAIIRYFICVIVLAVLAVFGWGNPIAGFFGIMGLKVAAYLQPFTHKMYNKIFHEQDPVPMPLSDEEFYEIYPGEGKEKEKGN